MAVVLNLIEYKRYRVSREGKEQDLLREQQLKLLEAQNSVPLMLKVLPGNALFPIPCQSRDEGRILAQIRILRDAEKSALQRAVQSNAGAGRAFIVFNSAKSKAAFVQRVRNHSIVSRLPHAAQPRAIRMLDEMNIAKWHFLPAPEPEDIDRDSASYPFARRMACMALINMAIIIVLLLFTSPVAITAAMASGRYSAIAVSVVSHFVDSVASFLAGLSPVLANLIFAYTPTLVYA